MSLASHAENYELTSTNFVLYNGYLGVYSKGNAFEFSIMAIGIYVRVSSTKGQETRSQEPDLQTWAKVQHDEVVWYRDRFTGTTMDRPGLERLLADVRSGRITKVCVWRLDRLGRTAKGLLTLLDELQGLNVGFVSLREGFDLGTPAGRLMAGVLASVAAYETEVRKERQLAGIAKAKADGKTWGGRQPGTRVKLTEEKELHIRRLHEQGVAVAAIARLVCLTRKTVYRALAPATA
jgi:DNA invertase Pin-like site-specific DNA recombinase